MRVVRPAAAAAHERPLQRRRAAGARARLHAVEEQRVPDGADPRLDVLERLARERAPDLAIFVCDAVEGAKTRPDAGRFEKVLDGLVTTAVHRGDRRCIGP